MNQERWIRLLFWSGCLLLIVLLVKCSLSFMDTDSLSASLERLTQKSVALSGQHLVDKPADASYDGYAHLFKQGSWFGSGGDAVAPPSAAGRSPKAQALVRRPQWVLVGVMQGKDKKALVKIKDQEGENLVTVTEGMTLDGVQVLKILNEKIVVDSGGQVIEISI